MVVMVATIALGLAACGSSDASGDTTPPAAESETTEPAATATGDATTVVSEADVADLEKQLDEIDQLLTGVDADLNHD
jgi:hypothetical protein